MRPSPRKSTPSESAWPARSIETTPFFAASSGFSGAIGTAGGVVALAAESFSSGFGAAAGAAPPGAEADVEVGLAGAAGAGLAGAGGVAGAGLAGAGGVAGA